MLDHFYVIFIVIIIESLLTGFWFLPYYTKGIVVFKKRIEKNASLQTLISVPFLESLDFSTIKFHQLSDMMIGFRGITSKSLFMRSSPAFSHGIIAEFDKYIEFKGYLSLSSITFIIFFCGIIIEDYDGSLQIEAIGITLLIGIAIFTIITQIAIGRFKELYDYVFDNIGK